MINSRIVEIKVPLEQDFPIIVFLYKSPLLGSAAQNFVISSVRTKCSVYK